MSKTPEAVAMDVRRRETTSKAEQVRKFKPAEVQANLQSILKDEVPATTFQNQFQIVRDPITWRERPITETYTDRICDDLDKWLEKDKKAKTIEEFLRDQKMTYDFYDMMRARSPRLQSMHDYAMMCLGIRREIGGLEGTLNSGLVDRSLHMYSRTYERGLEKREEVKAKYAAANTTTATSFKIIDQDVVIPNFVEKE